MQDTLVFCKGFQQAAKFDILARAKIPKRPWLDTVITGNPIICDILLQPSFSSQSQKLSAASYVF